MSATDHIKKIEDTIKECYSTWGERYYADYYESEVAYPPVHTDLVRSLLDKERPKNLLDVGCGPASMMRDITDFDIDLYGFDLTLEMVTEAKKIMSEKGLNPDHIWQGSALDAPCYQNEKVALKAFKSALCFGVLPHIPAETDQVLLENINGAVEEGGLIMVEARNELFSLFTMNRPTSEFLYDRLVDFEGLTEKNPSEANALNAAKADLDQRFRMDLPPIRKGYEDEPGYDEVLSRMHNPFELKAKAEAIGMKNVQVLFYHFHALPPMVAHHLPETFRKESVAMEDPYDWRGHFMASAFVLVGRASH